MGITINAAPIDNKSLPNAEQNIGKYLTNTWLCAILYLHEDTVTLK